MDRKTILAFVLIAIVFSAWLFISSTTTTRDITPKATAKKIEQHDKAVSQQQQSAAADVLATPATSEPERIITIETDVLRARISSHGGTIKSWKLKQYRPWYDSSARVDLVQQRAHEFGFDFRARDGGRVQSKDISFSLDAPDSIRVSDSNQVTITAVAKTKDGGTIERRYTFHGSSYDVGTSLTFDGMENSIAPVNNFVNLSWKKGIRYQEHSAVDESNNAVAMVSINGDISEYDAPNLNSPAQTMYSGPIDWIATRSKYFVVAIKPETKFDGNVYVDANKFGTDSNGTREEYGLSYKLPYKGGRQTHAFTLYAGPMQYDTLKHYGLTGVMNFGWKWIVKPIGEYFMLPTLKFIRSFVGNWGIAIIIFGVMMKFLLYPLSIQQMRSARKMQLVAPLLNQVREKHKDDMAAQQKATMAIYSDYGINPAGGCLPLVLQMPFLYALYSVLNLNVDLRQAGFLPIWLTDLSVPDVILNLGFQIPLFGIDRFSGLALIMGLTLFVQQKQAVSDPRQKAMVYIMPVMLTLMFSSLPSGLNLYYFVFNVLGIAQQYYINNFSKNKLTLDDLKKMPKKEGWLQKRLRVTQEMAEAQGRMPKQANNGLNKNMQIKQNQRNPKKK